MKLVNKEVRFPFDVLGNVAIVKFPEKTSAKEKKNFAKKLMSENNSVKTVLEKTGKFSGRLRKQKTKYVLGEKSKEVLYRENGCVFRFNVDDTYFSPRLSNERKEISNLIKKGEKVLVMFAGVSPFSIAIGKSSPAAVVYSNEINRKANEYGKLNIERNKLKNRVILVPGDIKKVAEKIASGYFSSTANPATTHQRVNEKNSYLNSKSSRASRKVNSTESRVGERDKIPNKFDVIVMPRPQLKDSFLREAFMLSKKGTRIYYYDFCKEDEIDSIVEKVKDEASKAKKKIRILNVKKAGEVGPYRYRIRVDFKVV